MALYYAMPAASLLMEVGFSELIGLAMFIVALIALVTNNRRK